MRVYWPQFKRYSFQFYLHGVLVAQSRSYPSQRACEETVNQLLLALMTAKIEIV